MPFAPHVFRHTPALQGRITPPETSEVRFGQERYDELDIQAAAEGWPPGWRMDHAEREANRQAVLKGRWDQDLWVFGYGSLIGDPGVYVEEYRYGALAGWQRRFCMRLEGGRGTHARPGLMAALDAGGHCDGVVIRIAADRVADETQFMWRREMFSGTYTPTFLTVETPQGPVDALVFLMDRANERYMPDLSDDTAAEIIATAEGGLGSNFDYLEQMVLHLEELGLEDAPMRKLYQRCLLYRRRDGHVSSAKTSSG